MRLSKYHHMLYKTRVNTSNFLWGEGKICVKFMLCSSSSSQTLILWVKWQYIAINMELPLCFNNESVSKASWIPYIRIGHTFLYPLFSHQVVHVKVELDHTRSWTRKNNVIDDGLQKVIVLINTWSNLPFSPCVNALVGSFFVCKCVTIMK